MKEHLQKVEEKQREIRSRISDDFFFFGLWVSSLIHTEHQVQHRKITVSVSDLLVVLGCPGGNASKSSESEIESEEEEEDEDLAYAVGLVSRFMENPGRCHWVAVRWILRYLKGSSDVCLTFTKSEKFEIEEFCDSDYSADLDRKRSISGYVFKVGDNTFSWRYTLQHVVGLSTTEAEYMALTERIIP
ncbi:hypothetical protein YC2023_023830 [Brassica napus]